MPPRSNAPNCVVLSRRKFIGEQPFHVHHGVCARAAYHRFRRPAVGDQRSFSPPRREHSPCEHLDPTSVGSFFARSRSPWSLCKADNRKSALSSPDTPLNELVGSGKSAHDITILVRSGLESGRTSTP